MLGIQPGEILCCLKAMSIVILLLSVVALPWLHRNKQWLQARLNLC